MCWGGGHQRLNWFGKLVHSKAITLYQTSMFTVLSELKHFQGVLKHNIFSQSCKGQILKRNMYPSLVGRRRWHWWLISENHSHTSLLKPLFLGAEYSFQVLEYLDGIGWSTMMGTHFCDGKSCSSIAKGLRHQTCEPALDKPIQEWGGFYACLVCLIVLHFHYWLMISWLLL